MVFELAERLGPSVEWWEDEPFAFVLWSHQLLDQLDRRRSWERRMERIEAAELMNLAVNQPERLANERSRIEASAAGRSSPAAASVIEIGERMARFIRKGKVLES